MQLKYAIGQINYKAKTIKCQFNNKTRIMVHAFKGILLYFLLYICMYPVVFNIIRIALKGKYIGKIPIL